MFKFLSHGLFETVFSPPLQKLVTTTNSRTVYTIIPPELLDHIIDHLRDDRITLWTCGLVSKQTLARSRTHLFSNLEFDDDDSHFDAFLTLLDTPWTSFTSAVKSLHIKDSFHQTGLYEYRHNKNIPRIVSNLSNLKALWLTSISWAYIPLHIRDFFFKLNIADFQLDSVLFSLNYDLVNLFCRLQPSLHSLSMYNLHFGQTHDLSPDLSTFQRPFHFKTFDSISLIPFKDVWDPATTKDPDITVESFHLRLNSLSSVERKLYAPFISRFLHHIGPSLRRLIINISCPFFSSAVLPYYESMDLSQCINIRVVHIGIITLDQVNMAKRTSSMLSTMWKLLSVLPTTNIIEEIFLTFSPKNVAEFETFAWLELILRLQKMFQNLKRTVIRVGAYGFMPCVEALRQAGMRQLEEDGLVSFEIVTRSPIPGTFEPWREATGSW